jgi:hypothetical protein
MSFIADKTAELRAAMESGNGTRAAEVITETVLESGDSFENTVAAMTEIDRNRHA